MNNSFRLARNRAFGRLHHLYHLRPKQSSASQAVFGSSSWLCTRTGTTTASLSTGTSTSRYSSSISVDKFNRNDGNESCSDNDSIEDESNSKKTFLVAKYQKMAKESRVALDDHQLRALEELDRLSNDILSSEFYTDSSASDDRSSSSIGDGEESDSLFHKFSNLFGTNLNPSPSKSLSQMLHKPPKGVYLHGGVGCGKTFCMDLFHNNLPVATNMKQKVHFHKFMLDVHRRMHEAKMVEKIEGDPLPAVIDDIINDGLIICFDEFQVTDVADALILRRLFTGLLERGAIVVATSNRPPKDLYLNGIQRDLFLPFIDTLEEKNNVVSMWESDVDYRLVQGENKARGVYFVGTNDEAAKDDFNQQFEKLTKGSSTRSTKLVTQGRAVDIPNASLEYKVARVSFDDMCRKPLGAADYLVIGDNFHTVFIEDVPKLTMNDVNLVRRFIVFIDSMYECHVKLIVHAEAMPDNIFEVDLDNEHCDEAFAFDRTRSRLEEMGSDEYLKRRWVGSTTSKQEDVEVDGVSVVDKSSRSVEVDTDDRDHVRR